MRRQLQLQWDALAETVSSHHCNDPPRDNVQSTEVPVSEPPTPLHAADVNPVPRGLGRLQSPTRTAPPSATARTGEAGLHPAALRPGAKGDDPAGALYTPASRGSTSIPPPSLTLIPGTGERLQSSLRQTSFCRQLLRQLLRRLDRPDTRQVKTLRGQRRARRLGNPPTFLIYKEQLLACTLFGNSFRQRHLTTARLAYQRQLAIQLLTPTLPL